MVKNFSILLVCLLVSSGLFAQEQASYRIDESGRFYQILRWERTNAYFYEVEVEQRTESGAWIPRLKEKTENAMLEVSLPPGRYRYRIVSYNVLGRAAAYSDWTLFRIHAARTPAAQRPDKTIIIPRNDKIFTLTLDGKDLIEGAEMYIMRNVKNAVPVKPLFVRFADDDTAFSAVFPANNLPAGKYELMVINPGGLKQTVPLTIARSAPSKPNVRQSQPADGSAFLTVTETGVKFPLDRGWFTRSVHGREAQIKYESEVIGGIKRQVLCIQIPEGSGIVEGYYQVGMRDDLQNILAQSGGIRFKVFSDKASEWRLLNSSSFHRYKRILYYPVTVRANQVVEVEIPWFKFNDYPGFYSVPFVKNGDFSLGFECLEDETEELKIFDLEIYKGALANDGQTQNRNAPVINKLELSDQMFLDDRGNPHVDANHTLSFQTINNSGYYGNIFYEFSAADPDRDWQALIHEIRINDTYVLDFSINLNEAFQNKAGTINYTGGYPLPGVMGKCEFSWYIIDRAGNKSQTVRKTIVLGTGIGPDSFALPYRIPINSRWRVDTNRGEGEAKYLSEIINGAMRQVLNIRLDYRKGWAGVFCDPPQFFVFGMDDVLEKSTGIRFKAYAGQARVWEVRICTENTEGPGEFGVAFSAKKDQVMEIDIP
jgi:hypothetical protein